MKPKKFSELLYHLYDTPLYVDPEITGIALDSREVKPGYLFFAYKGTQQDGREFIPDAIKNGAVAVLAEVDSKYTPVHLHDEVPILPVDHLNQRVGEIAAKFYGEPAKNLKIVGITGTNGKTSCSHFIAEALKKMHISCGVIGTLGSGLYGDIKLGNLTTPDAIAIQRTLADFVEQGAEAVAMEVSSHSIDQGRINGIEFEVAVFTNLTQDHLDYHGTMEAYGAAKKKLFESPLTKFTVINADDNFGKHILTSLSNENMFSYSLSPPLGEKTNVVYVDDIQLTHAGIQAKVFTPWGNGEIKTSLMGEFNLSNILAALTSLCLLKVPFEAVLHALNYLSPVPGRMQVLGGRGVKPLVVVDYSHTPDSLEKALVALRQHCEGKLYCLFGCGGDRDRGKRPLMAKIAEQYADHVMVTDDNPRTEDPIQIVDDIMQGFSEPNKIIIQHDRSNAIRDIIQYAKVSDCVLIAGKGAETYQQVGTTKIPFSDIEKAMENLN